MIHEGWLLARIQNTIIIQITNRFVDKIPMDATWFITILLWLTEYS